jgi:hypothetical protein
MFELAVVTGLLVAGVLIGVMRSRRSSEGSDIPNPFARTQPKKK